MRIRLPKIRLPRLPRLKSPPAAPQPIQTEAEREAERARAKRAYYNAMLLDHRGLDRLARERGFGSRKMNFQQDGITFLGQGQRIADSFAHRSTGAQIRDTDGTVGGLRLTHAGQEWQGYDALLELLGHHHTMAHGLNEHGRELHATDRLDGRTDVIYQIAEHPRIVRADQRHALAETERSPLSNDLHIDSVRLTHEGPERNNPRNQRFKVAVDAFAKKPLVYWITRPFGKPSWRVAYAPRGLKPPVSDAAISLAANEASIERGISRTK